MFIRIVIVEGMHGYVRKCNINEFINVCIPVTLHAFSVLQLKQLHVKRPL